MKKFKHGFLVFLILILSFGVIYASQDDYVIDNQTFPNFRADLNNNLEAIATNNSGTMEPTTTFPFMLWADTTAGVMKQRNAADTAFIDIWNLSTGIPVNLPAAIATGTVSTFAGTTAPTDWVLADGSSLDSVSDTTLTNLFSLIGTTYGGTGAANFNVPDLRGRAVIGLDNLGGTPANRIVNANADSLGGAAGSETVTLTTLQLSAHTHTGPSHNHTIAHTHNYDSRPPTITGSAGGASGVNCCNTTTLITAGTNTPNSGSGGTAATGSAGSSSAHNVDQPWLAMTIIIKK